MININPPIPACEEYIKVQCRLYASQGRCGDLSHFIIDFKILNCMVHKESEN